MALFGHGSGLVTELPTLAVLMVHFGHYIANFDGVPSELPPSGSSDGTLLTLKPKQFFVSPSKKVGAHDEESGQYFLRTDGAMHND